MAVLLSAATADIAANETKQTDQKEVPQFRNDVIPILTKLRCNSGGCHGKSTGQNGFKLSLLGFHPDLDYSAMVQEGRNRRVLVAAADRSLLLLKAVGKMPHGGGRRLDADSTDYRILKAWIESGAPGPSADEPKLEKITITPGQHVLLPETQQQLTVTAHFSDGRKRDVTERAIFESNAPEIAEVNQAGLVTTRSGGGLFAVMARFGVQIGVFQGTVPFRQDLESPQVHFDAASLTDKHMWNQWKRLGIAPSPEADDATFIRRATLDVCGSLPTAEEVTAYLADDRPDKRERLIERLLTRPEYASYFAMKWAAILQNRGRGYSTGKQRPGTALFTAWVRDSIAENKPYDRFVAEIITATGSQEQNPPTIWYRTVRKPREYVESIAQAFLGVRIQCAQCHHHPAERWTQDDYYGLAAVFSRIGRKRGFADAEVPTSEMIYLKDEGEVLHPRTGESMRPRPLGGPDFANETFDDPRRKLAKWMTAEDNPFFARTLVNRLWGHFLGRGIIHPIDDARSTNPPSNPELLDELSRDFIANGFDVKHLIRRITGSRAYRLSSEPTAENEQDQQNYARFYPRRLPAEVLLDAISQVLEVPTEFSGGPGTFPEGTRAIELPDENVPLNFLDVFGRPARTSACECERSDSPALAQTLELVNSKEIQRKLTANNGYVEKLAANGRGITENVNEIFLRTFARPPRPEEQRAAEDFLKNSDDNKEAYRSLLWALLATNEFLFNH